MHYVRRAIELTIAGLLSTGHRATNNGKPIAISNVFILPLNQLYNEKPVSFRGMWSMSKTQTKP